MGIFSKQEVNDASADETPEVEAATETAPVVEAESDVEPVEAVAEGEAEPAKEADSEPPKGFVPHAALHAERMRVQELRARDAQREARLVALETMLREKAAPADPEPVDDDPVAALARIEAQLRDRETREHAARQNDAVQQYVQRDIEAFKAKQPDFDAATQHLVDSRVNELRLMGYGADEIRADIDAYDAHIARTAATAGLSVGEMVYSLAQQRGYRPVEAAPAVVAPTASAKVAAMAKGQASERSIGAAAGSAGASTLNIRALLDMSDADFAKATANDADFKRYAGA